MAWLDGLLADASGECLASQRGCTSPPRCSGTSAIGDASKDVAEEGCGKPSNRLVPKHARCTLQTSPRFDLIRALDLLYVPELKKLFSAQIASGILL